LAPSGDQNQIVCGLARYVQSLQAEAAEIRARVQALVAAAKRSPSSETPD
jgi:hypothetical protein